MAEKITDLHLQTDDDTIVRPNIVRQNIPNNAVDKQRLDSEVQQSLEKADSAMQYIADGSVTKLKLDAEVRQSLAKADSAMQNIDDGSITKAKLSSGVQQSLDKADTALQDIEDNSIDRDMLDADVQASLNKADTAMQGIADGSVTKQKLSSGVQQSLDKADTALQSIPTNSVGTDELKSESVTAGKLASGAVTNTKIDDGAVSNSKITDNTIEGSKIKVETITNNNIANDTINSSKFNQGTREKLVEVIELSDSVTSGTLTEAQLMLLSQKNVIIKYGIYYLQRIYVGSNNHTFALLRVDTSTNKIVRYNVTVIIPSGIWSYTTDSPSYQDVINTTNVGQGPIAYRLGLTLGGILAWDNPLSPEIVTVNVNSDVQSGTLTSDQINELWNATFARVKRGSAYFNMVYKSSSDMQLQGQCDADTNSDGTGYASIEMIVITKNTGEWTFYTYYNDFQEPLTTSSVSDGTIAKNIGFDSNGNIVKQTPSGGGGGTDLTTLPTGYIQYAVGLNNQNQPVKELAKTYYAHHVTITEMVSNAITIVAYFYFVNTYSSAYNTLTSLRTYFTGKSGTSISTKISAGGYVDADASKKNMYIYFTGTANTNCGVGYGNGTMVVEKRFSSSGSVTVSDIHYAL